MKKLAFLMFFAILFADTPRNTESFLNEKIKNFVGEKDFTLNENFLRRIFRKQGDFFRDGELDNSKILHALKDNGLLDLSLPDPQQIRVIFRSQTGVLFLLLSLKNALQSMGYSYFEVKKVTQNEGDTEIVVSLFSEYMIDPLIMMNELNNRGYIFDDVRRVDPKTWRYDVTLIDPRLQNAKNIYPNSSAEMRDVSGEYWLGVTQTGRINIIANNPKWRPKIVFFDKNLQILDILRRESSLGQITFQPALNTRFMLISDLDNPTAIRSGIKISFE